jgi:hypothetical protein
MKSNLNGGEIITLREAIDYTHAFQEKYPDTTRSFQIDKSLVEKIIRQPGCTGLRIYNGLVSDQTNLVLIGVDEKGEDLKDGIIADRFKRCPPDCPKSLLIR